MKYKATMKELETYLSIENALRIIIKKDDDMEWLDAINSLTLGITTITPMQHRIDHNLNIVDITDLTCMEVAATSIL